eukprot:6025992-Pyramimonas_sp.AAC.1
MSAAAVRDNRAVTEKCPRRAASSDKQREKALSDEVCRARLPRARSHSWSGPLLQARKPAAKTAPSP